MKGTGTAVVLTVFAFLLLAGCASAPRLPTPPMPATLPSAAVESICGTLHSEGLMSEVRAVRTTQPLLNSSTLQALADLTPSSDRGAMAPEIATAPPLPVDVPSGLCVQKTIDKLDPIRDADAMVLQFSSPFANPFANGQFGVLARLSLGSEAVTWYWIPLAERSGHWMAGRPAMLTIR